MRGLSESPSVAETCSRRPSSAITRALVLLCSFQKEESVLVDELVRLAPDARIVTIDTGVLFPETLATWRAFEERFGVTVEVEDARGATVDRARALLRRRKVAALERALAGADGWITGIRREQSPGRARTRSRSSGTEARRSWKYNPLVEVDREGPVAADLRA